MKPIFARQSGATLLVSLIMLILLSLMTLTTFKLSKTSLQIAGNQQQRSQALAAAQSAIEEVISSTRFATAPDKAILAPCNKEANTTCVDLNADGTTDVKVVVTPTCVSSQVIPVAALDFTSPSDAGCIIGTGQSFGVEGGASNNSLCANMLWDIQAVAADAVTNAQYVVNQGTAVRVSSTTLCP
ncbi:MAG: hypothetical protein HYZ65_07065 [Burkholderiales bacterium]|nr:hypothetical protein [Burkholderiales bacterium]